MELNRKYKFRFMKVGEEKDIYELIIRVFKNYVAPTYSQQGVETFLNMLSIDFLKETNSDKFTIVAEYSNGIIGIISVIKTSHIALLFINSKFQKHGIGKKMIQYCVGKCLEFHPKLKTITVSSTPNSQLFYQKVGFTKMGEEQNENGMRFIPMQKKLYY